MQCAPVIPAAGSSRREIVCSPPMGIHVVSEMLCHEASCSFKSLLPVSVNLPVHTRCSASAYVPSLLGLRTRSMNDGTRYSRAQFSQQGIIQSAEVLDGNIAGSQSGFGLDRRIAPGRSKQVQEQQEGADQAKELTFLPAIHRSGLTRPETCTSLAHEICSRQNRPARPAQQQMIRQGRILMCGGRRSRGNAETIN